MEWRRKHSSAHRICRHPCHLIRQNADLRVSRSLFSQDQIRRRTTQIRIRPTTADPMPTARRMLSGVASALFIARRIQAGLAANNNPSSTNRMPTPMRKSANAMDLIGTEPPVCFFWFERAEMEAPPRQVFGVETAKAQGFGAGAAPLAADAGAAAPLPTALPKKRKKSESGFSRKRVSEPFRPVS